jgi:hypothetical protein
MECMDQPGRVLTRRASAVDPTSSNMTSPSSPPVTIHDLPLETIGHIITIAHPSYSDECVEEQARRRFYLDTSLVCRDWTPFAQRALWKFVTVDEFEVNLLIESDGAWRYPIEKLTVVGAANTTSLGSLLTSVRGVRDLKFQVCDIDGSWICGTNWKGESRCCHNPRYLLTRGLADLKSLTLEETMVVSTSVSAYHFSLAHLALHCTDNDSLSDETIVALSRQVTITSLDLHLDESRVEMLVQLSPLAPQLVRLDLDMLDDDGAAVPRIVDPFLELCTRLKHLTFSDEYTLSVIHLPRLLESWTLTYCEEANVALTLDVLNSKATAVSKLERLCIQPKYAADVIDAVCEAQSWDGWSEVEEVCRQKKIRLSVGSFGSEEVQGESHLHFIRTAILILQLSPSSSTLIPSSCEGRLERGGYHWIQRLQG